MNLKVYNSLVIFAKASQMLAEANTIQQAKELKDLAITAGEWAKRKKMGKEAEDYCRSYAIDAERKMGEMLASVELAKGGTPYKNSTGKPGLPVEKTPTLKELGITKTESSQAQKLAEISDEKFKVLKDNAIKENSGIKKIIQIIKKEEHKTKLESKETKQAKKIKGVYDVIIIDPPWDVGWIPRSIRPNQVALDYETMSNKEIEELKIPYADDCHIFLWTTQKFLPTAFEILKKWGLDYVCTFVWHKPGGFQIVGLPQYNCEFCLYAKKGSPKFTDTKAFNTCFEGKRGKHSEKPEEFYETIRRTTAGRRLDMFSRRKIEGFDSWGKEAK